MIAKFPEWPQFCKLEVRSDRNVLIWGTYYLSTRWHVKFEKLWPLLSSNWHPLMYSSNKITKTQIQISRQNWSYLFSNISHQMMIWLCPIVSKSKSKGYVQQKKWRNLLLIHNYSPMKFWQTMIKCSFCFFLILLQLYAKSDLWSKEGATTQKTNSAHLITQYVFAKGGFKSESAG